MTYKYLKSSDIKNKTVLLRVDFNEELDDNGKIVDDFRIKTILPTLALLKKQNAKIVILSHAGRPEGKFDAKLSLKPMAERLASLLKVKFVETEDRAVSYPIEHIVFISGDINNPSVRQAVADSQPKDIVVLENLRFYAEEEKNEASFAKILASLGDVFVNDAFAVAHRTGASIVGITKEIPSFAGPLLEKEIKNLDYILSKAKKPFVLMMGGIKISDKAKTLERLGEKADHILVGGGLANIFFAANGLEIGMSIVEKDSEKLAWKLLKNFKDKIVLPKDVAVFDTNNPQEKAIVKEIYNIRKSEKICDIGPKAILEYAKILKTAKTICWNGPVGYFEKKPFRAGTMSLARIVGAVSKGKAFGVAGGGETVAAIRQAHQFENIDHVSTGGGAMLEYLAGDKLPGLKALEKK
jgi:phosphoglycerate kinase